MNVRNHRIAAGSLLLAEVVVLLAWGRSMAVDSPEIADVRARFQGEWVASSIQAGAHRKVVGERASGCSVVFDGKQVILRRLVDNIDAKGTFYIESSRPGQIDLKLDAGWIIGLYQFEGDHLELCLNPFSGPERLGVPTLPRPRSFDSGESRHVYEFRRRTAED